MKKEGRSEIRDVSSGEIPQERVFGIVWQIEKDTLGFQLQIPRKTLTRQGLLSVLSSAYTPLGIAGPFLLEEKSVIQELCKNDFIVYTQAGKAGKRVFFKNLARKSGKEHSYC